MPRPEAGDRLRRLLAILPWLAREGGAELSQVAQRTSMSIDEVVKLLEMAACCGLPPYTPDSLIELIVHDDRVEANLDSLLSRPMRFNASEGFTVAAAARAILAVPGADRDGALARALSKLEDALGERERVSVDLDDPALLDSVRHATEGHQQLELDYYSASRDQMTHRVVDPIAVFAHGGHWYLDAYCHSAEGLRHFRVDRIEVARPTGESSPGTRPIPDRTDRAPKAPGRSDDVFMAGPDTPMLRISVPPGGRWIAEAYPTEAVVEAEDGQLEVTLAVGGEAWLERLLLRLGPEARVLDPPELALVGRSAAKRLLSSYKDVGNNMK